jgi:hypothetical protein
MIAAHTPVQLSQSSVCNVMANGTAEENCIDTSIASSKVKHL